MEAPHPAPPPPPAARKRPTVDLSMASIIWIMVIVGVCTGGGNNATEREIERLQAQINRLEKKIDRLTAAQRRPASAPPGAAATPAR